MTARTLAALTAALLAGMVWGYRMGWRGRSKALHERHGRLGSTRASGLSSASWSGTRES